MKLLSLSVLVVAVASVGCLQQREFVDPTSNLGIENGGAESRMAVRSGSVRGDFGSRRGFDGPATQMEGASDYEFKTSNVVVTREESARGAGMVILFTQNRTLEQLEVGRHEFANDPESIDQGDIMVSVCSGESAGSIDYDQPADRGHLVVSNDPEGGRRIDVHTETAELDPVTGDRDFGNLEVSDTSFVFVPGGSPE